MPYDEDLAERVRVELRDRRDLVEKSMFGGLGFLLHGNMLVAIWNDSLVARVGPAAYASSLERPHVREFDITGRPMRGWVVVEPEGLETSAALASWLQACLAFVETLPAK